MKKYKKAAIVDFDLVDTLREYLDDTTILENLIRALDTDTTRDCLEYIARNYEIPLEDEIEARKQKRLIRLSSLVDNICQTLNDKNFNTSCVEELRNYFFDDKQISYLVSLKYGLNGQPKMDKQDWDTLVSLIYADLSLAQIKAIAKLVVADCTKEQIELVEKYNLNPEEIAIVKQNFFDTNENIEQAEAWIKTYL